MRVSRSLVSLVLVLVSIVACGRREPESPPPFAIRPANDLLIQRVEAAYSAVRRGGEVWPGFDKTDVVAMLIYDAKGEWFFGEAGDLRGFDRTGQTFHGVSITYAEPSLFLTVRSSRTARSERRGSVALDGATSILTLRLDAPSR